MASIIPQPTKKAITNYWAGSETWKVALFTSASNCLTQTLYTGCTNEIVYGAPYVAGGQTLTKSASDVLPNAMLDATDVAWAAVTFADVKYVVVYNTADNQIRAVYDLNAGYSVTAGTFTIIWNASGLIRVNS